MIKKSILTAISLLLLISCNSQKGPANETPLITQNELLKTEQLDPVVIASLNEQMLTPFYVAHGADITTKNDIHFRFAIEKEIHSLYSKLSKGDYHLLVLPLYEYLLIRDEYKDHTVFSFVAGWSYGSHSLVTNKEGLTLDRFSGQRIAAATHSSEFQMARFLTQLNGVTPDSINWQLVKSSKEALELLKNGNVDAAAINFESIPKAGKFNTLASSREAPFLIPYVIVTREIFPLKHPDEFQQILSTLIEAGKIIKYKKKETIAAIKKSNIQDAEAEKMAGNFLPASYYDNYIFFIRPNEDAVNIEDIIEPGSLLPASRGALSSKAIHSYYSTLPLVKLHESSPRLANRFYQNFYPGSSFTEHNSSRIFSFAVKEEKTEKSFLSPAQRRELGKISKLSYLFPSAQIRLEYKTMGPHVEEAYRYLRSHALQGESRVVFHPVNTADSNEFDQSAEFLVTFTVRQK